MPGFIGFPELIVLGLVLLLIFGPKRLPEMGRSLGHGMREFKDSVTNNDREPSPLPVEHPVAEVPAVEDGISPLPARATVEVRELERDRVA
jgi:sec-independent protein translocase protein TatA